MAATSLDLRVRIVEAYENREGFTPDIGQRFGVAALRCASCIWQEQLIHKLES